MTFVRDICTSQIFKGLRLPRSLVENQKLNPIDRHLVFDIETGSALIPIPFDHSTYPDRQLNFYVEEKHFNIWELVQRSDGPDRVEIYFNKSATAEERTRITGLVQEAVGVLRGGFGESPSLLPVVCSESGLP